MRARIWSRRTPLVALVASGLLTGVLALQGAGCQQQATTVAVRSLERSGRVSFVCLGPPGVAGDVERPLEECTTQQFADVYDYYYEDDAGDVDAGSGYYPHLYALVTQTTRGEVAVVDVSSTQRNVLDQNPVEPGANFLPIGALPTAIVSTPHSAASFVSVAEIGRAGIFALPSSMIRPANTSPLNAGGAGGTYGTGGAGGGFAPSVPHLSSWPACALPSAPGDMILVADPLVAGLERRSCDDPEEARTVPLDTISQELQGRQKLVVAMPDLGGVAVIDAQTLLDQPAGSFDPCPVERWVPLEVDLTGLDKAPDPPPAPANGACVNPSHPQPALEPPYTPRPAGLAYADGTLYVADLAAPVIHVVDMPTPCEPVERAPLVPSSVDDPKRPVTTEHISVSPAPTPDLKRYLYATDFADGSVMVFDVGPNSTSRRPLQRQHPEWNPFEPRDRMRFAAPAADILVVQRDVPATNPVTGLAPAGVRCDPDPTKAVCTATSTSCDLGTIYQTDRSNYSSGAGPGKLRGTFAFAALTNGHLAVIDVDDFDARCRGPVLASTLSGCAANDSNEQLAQNTSWEESCNVVLPNAVRASTYEVTSDTVGNHVPGVANFPQLYNTTGGVVEFSTDSVQMVAPDPIDKNALPKYPGTPVPVGDVLYVGGVPVALTGSDDNGVFGSAVGQHTLAMNLEDPRAHVVDQGWSATFEGPIPGFEERLADLRTDASKGAPGVYDARSRFCDSGVLSEKAARAMYEGTDGFTRKDEPVPDGCFEDDPAQEAAYKAARDDNMWARIADYVQITSPLPDQGLPYWQNQDACTYTECYGLFGTPEVPNVGRDLRIVEAYQDHVELTQRPAWFEPPLDKLTHQPTCDFPPEPAPLDKQLKCCFPDALAYTVRVGSQWIVVGDQSGFLHHVVADPASGVCRNSCDAAAARKNGRAFELAAEAPTPTDGDPLVFVNPMFRFAIRSGAKRSLSTGDAATTDRDKVFRWNTAGSFTPLFINLSADGSLIQPQALSFLAPTDELAIPDGASNGLLFVSLSSAALSRSFY